MVVMIPGLHHKVVLRIRAGAVLPIIIVKAIFHIRVKVTMDTEAVDPVATKTVMDTGIVHHTVEILVILINQCGQVKVIGHYILGVWNLHRLITTTDTHLLQYYITMIGAHHPLLMGTYLLPEKGEEVADIKVVGMIVTGVGLPLYLHYIIIPRGGTENLEIIFCYLCSDFIMYVCCCWHFPLLLANILCSVYKSI